MKKLIYALCPVLLSLYSCSSSFEEEALMDTKHSTVPIIDFSPCLAPSNKENSILSSYKAGFPFFTQNIKDKYFYPNSNKKEFYVSPEYIPKNVKEPYEIIDEVITELEKANPELFTSIDKKWNVKIMNSKERNAYTTGNGEIYVGKEMLWFMKNREELMGILAHEMAHNLHNDVYKKALFLGTMVVSSVYISRVYPLRLISRIGLVGFQYLGFTGYSRKLEKEADKKACELLSNANVSPLHLADYFNREKKYTDRLFETKLSESSRNQNISEEGRGPLLSFIKLLESVLSSHPSLEERVDRIKKYLNQDNSNLLAYRTSHDKRFDDAKATLILHEFGNNIARVESFSSLDSEVD